MSFSPHPLVSIVILNWKKPLDTIECIKSLRDQTYKNTEFIIVENGSGDNSVELLSDIPDITLVKNKSNRGFTGGHIDGLKHAKGEYIFVLNNDAVVDPKYIATAVGIFNENPKAAVVGGRSYAWREDKDKYKTNIPYYAFQTIDPITAEGIFVANDSSYAHRTCWVSGSAMIIKREVIEKVGYFYDPMFAYYEESDLFARIITHNYDIVYSPDLRIWHKMGASSSSYFQYFQLFTNRAAFATRSFRGMEYIRFIKSYISSSLRSIVSSYLKWSTLSNEDQNITRARLSALMASMIRTPLWLISKRKLKARNKTGLTYTDILRNSETGLSYVFDGDSLDISKKTVIDAIKLSSYYHYHIEYIIVCNSESKYSKYSDIISKQLDGYPVYLALNRNQTQYNPLNLGWLSCSKNYVIFGKSVPSLAEIDTSIASTAPNKMIFVMDDYGALVSRSMLALYGGLIFDNVSDSYAALADFANNFKSSPSKNPEVKYTKESNGDIAKTRRISTIHQYDSSKKRNGLWWKIIEKYYRIYQVTNLLLFLTASGIPLRLRFGRIKNVLVYSASFDKKSLALELKHMNNDVVKRFHPEFDLKLRQKELLEKARIGGDLYKNTPVFIICRDRVSTLEQLVSWLEAAGLKNIFLIDNDSTYPDLVKYLRKSPYQVIFTRKNVGHTVAWAEGLVKSLCYGEYYVVSDPDVIPDESCPDNALNYLYDLHERYIGYHKVGFGLKIDDLPDHYPLKGQVIRWESQFWKTELEPDVYDAAIDTTFALYKPYTYEYTLHPSIRTGRPYVASHLPWYTNGTQLDEEESYYRLRASQDITSWNSNEILDRYKKVLK